MFATGLILIFLLGLVLTGQKTAIRVITSISDKALKDVFYLLWGGLTVNTFFAAGLWLVSSGWGLVVEEKAIALSDITGIILVFILGVVLLIKTLLAKTKLG